MDRPQTLDDYITLSGKKKSYLAELLGMKPQTFRLKRKNPAKFTVSEFLVLYKELNIESIEEAKRVFLIKK